MSKEYAVTGVKLTEHETLVKNISNVTNEKMTEKVHAPFIRYWGRKSNPCAPPGGQQGLLPMSTALPERLGT